MLTFIVAFFDATYGDRMVVAFHGPTEADIMREVFLTYGPHGAGEVDAETWWDGFDPDLGTLTHWSNDLHWSNQYCQEIRLPLFPTMERKAVDKSLAR